MKNYVLLLALVLGSLSSKAQFIREIYKSPSTATSLHATVPANDSPTANLYTVGSYGNQLIVSEIKQTGAVLWTKRIKVNSVNYTVNSMFLDSDGMLVMAGGKSIGVDDDAYGFVARFDPISKTLLWFSQTGTTVWFYDIAEGTPGGSYYASGQEEDQGTGNQADHVVYSVNRSSGTMTMISNLNKNVNETAECIVFDNSTGSIYTAGRYELSSGASKFRICLTKMDTLGVDDFTNYYVKSTALTARMYAQDMMIDDSTIVIVGFGDASGTSTFKYLYFLRMDLSGNILTTKEYDITSPASDGILASVKKTDEGYILYGHLYSGSDGDVLLMNVDNLGNINWANTYPYRKRTNQNGYYMLSSLAVVNGYAFNVGQKLMVDGSQRGIFMRVPVSTGDAGTCETPITISATDLANYQSATTLNSCTFTTTWGDSTFLVRNIGISAVTTCSVNGKEGEELDPSALLLENNEFIVFPSPANDEFRLNYSSDLTSIQVTVMSTTGQVIYRNEAFDKDETISCTDWPAGVYVVTADLGDKKLSTNIVIQ